MGSTTKQFDREFLGKIKDFENEEEMKFERKHLKSYLKGYEKFTYGFEQRKSIITGLMETVPKWHDVQQNLIDLNLETLPK